MSTLTIRNLDSDVKERLRIRAAQHGHSMEEEVRIILRRAVSGASGDQLWALSRQLFSGEQGIDLPAAARSKDRPAPDFGADSSATGDRSA